MKNLYLFVLCCFVFNMVRAQEAVPLKKNSVYFEAGGNALFYSLNYDRLIPVSPNIKIAPRVGLSYLPYDGGTTFKNLIIPVELNVLYAKNPESKNFVEGGLGLTFIEFVNGFRDANRKDPVSKFANTTTLRAGFRHQKPTGGLMYRAGILVPIARNDFADLKAGDDIFFKVWAGFSLGYTF